MFGIASTVLHLSSWLSNEMSHIAGKLQQSGMEEQERKESKDKAAETVDRTRAMEQDHTVLGGAVLDKRMNACSESDSLEDEVVRSTREDDQTKAVHNTLDRTAIQTQP